MTEIINLRRRDLLKSTIGLSGGLILGFRWPALVAQKTSAAFTPNAFIRIAPDDFVSFFLGTTQMGQGVFTSLAMLIAEELEVDLSRVHVETGPVDHAYDHPFFGMQVTGGSTSVLTCWEPFRKAGAAAREMLLSAAAQTWGVSPSTCRAESGSVIHPPSGRRLSYGQLAESASQLTPPKTVALKDPANFKLLGKPTPRLDSLGKATGKAIYGIDVAVPGMLTAVVARASQLGGKVTSFKVEKAKAVPGVKAVLQIDSGIAVVANNFWAATKGRDALEISWSEGPSAGFGCSSQREDYARLASQPGMIAKNEGDVLTVMSRAVKTVEATFELPYLAHAPMEPLNCVADVRPGSCEVWTGTQFQTLDRDAAAKAAGLEFNQVKLHTALVGGGFGRRGVPDGHFVREAVQISQAIKAPVKVVWTREDDICGGYYRPAYRHALKAGLDSKGHPIAWTHRIVGQSVLTNSPFESRYVKNGIDVDSVWGAISLPYYVPNLHVDVHSPATGPRVWAWRSVGSSHNAFVVEGFVDELAHAAGKDPYEFRQELLWKNPRYAAVLKLAAEKAGWGNALPNRQGRGIAIHEFGSIVAQVAEVSVSQQGEIKVHRVVCAIDCGTAVNPETIRAQMEGGIAFGLSAALFEELTLEKGRVQQSNFHDYKVLRIPQMPLVEVHILPSTAPPNGIGEAGVPPIAPAVANAIFAVTGKRLRHLPIRSEDLA